jgi:aspartate aminotransferase
MPVSSTITEQISRASWIRRMFEEGTRLRAERGAENVYDFSLGNPDVEPPTATIDTLRRVVEQNAERSHAYMPNAGFVETRAVIAEQLSRQTGLAYTADHVIMTVGAAGAMNTAFKALLDPGDEVIILTPWFAEYLFYITNHGGTVVQVDTDDRFQPDIDRIAAAITPRTKAIILNSPNNPTGAIYPAEILDRLNALLTSLDHPVMVVSDEPYRELALDGTPVPPTPKHIANTLTAYSWSKAMAVPGERIGYLAISPRIEHAKELVGACVFANRILGFVNAPAIWQRVVAETPDAVVDIGPYREKRDLVCDALESFGYDLVRPSGAFYVFPRTPIDDDIAFVRMLQEEGILCVPGSGFGRSGYMRLSLTVPRETIERSLPGFKRAIERVR